MILASLALAAMTATAAPAASFGHLVHLHTHADTRVSLTLYNTAALFRDVEVDGRTYTIPTHGSLSIKAPVGTRIYAASPSPTYRRGDIMVELTPQSASSISLR